MRKRTFLLLSLGLLLLTILLPNLLPSSTAKDLVQDKRSVEPQPLQDEEDTLLALTLGNIKNIDPVELEEAKRLLRENKAIKYGKLFNFFFSKLNFWNELDIEDIALFEIEPAITAGKKTVDLIRDSRKLVSEWRDISTRERKALVKYENFLRRYPQSKYAPAIQRKLQKLKAKKRQHDHLREMKLAKQALQDKDFTWAKRHYQKALNLLPNSNKEISAALDKLTELERDHLARKNPLEMVKPGGEIFLTPAEKDNYEKLLLSLTKHDADALLSASQGFVQNHKNSPLRDEAEIAVALAYEFQDDLTQAKKVFGQVGEKYPQSNMGRYARSIAANPHYDLYASIKKTVKDQKKEAVKYVLLGENSNLNLPREDITGWAKKAYHFKKEQKQVSSPSRILSRTFEVFVQKKVPTNKTIISLGEEYLKKYSHSKRAPEIRKIVAQAYEKEKIFNAALFHYNLTGNVASDKLKELEDKAAIDLLQEVTEDKKDLYYANILELYPRSDAAHLIRKYINNKRSGSSTRSNEKGVGINFGMFPGSSQMMSLLGGNSWLIKTRDNSLLPVYHPLLGLNLDFGRESNTLPEQGSKPGFFGLPLHLQKEWVKEDEYSMGYRLWDEKQFAVGNLSLNQWSTAAQLGVNKKGPNTRIHLPIPVIKNFIPMALTIRAKLGRVQFLPVMEDSELDDAALYQD